MNKKSLAKKVDRFVKMGKLQEALNAIVDVADFEIVDPFGITTGQIIKDIFKESDLKDGEDAGSIINFSQLDDNKYYTEQVLGTVFSNKGIIVHEINEDLICELLKKVA